MQPVMTLLGQIQSATQLFAMKMTMCLATLAEDVQVAQPTHSVMMLPSQIQIAIPRFVKQIKRFSLTHAKHVRLE